MINSKVSTSIYHDNRRVKKMNKYPVKLCVSYNGKSMYYSISIDLTVKEFKKLSDKRVSKEIADIKNHLQKTETDARNVISMLKPFSLESFKKKFLQKPTNQNALKAVFDEQIGKLKTEDRVSTAHSYRNTYSSLVTFKPNLSFEEISADFLKRYEKWMLEHRKSIIYMRTLRAIFNEAIHQEIIQKEYYPFGKCRYQIPKGKNIKKTHSLEDVEKIYNYQP